MNAIDYVKKALPAITKSELSPLTQNAESIALASSLFEDEASRNAFQKELAFMLLRRLIPGPDAVKYAGNVTHEHWVNAIEKARTLIAKGDIPKLDLPLSAQSWEIPAMYTSTFIFNQYSTSNVTPENTVFLDCGGCCGETAVWAVMHGAKKVYCFEPNPILTPYLQSNLQKYCQGKAGHVPYGVGEKEGDFTVELSHESIGSAQLVPAAKDTPRDQIIPVTTIDNWCTKNNIIPGFIKMDIEGAENAALKGAAKTIAAHKPKLAICLYHSLNDMWEIPILIKQIMPNYRLWCRKNAEAVEFVLYASV
ncbi:FkbM family methyltransferase [Elusimicrobium simillimum]|uniref:FkbM family methyltransferase n=1 Tax=Elusimicrobium simillimum TaxID=3143438 RepID=UPI003C700A94